MSTSREVVSFNGQFNIVIDSIPEDQSVGIATISVVKLHCRDPLSIIELSNSPLFDEDVVHFLPNSGCVSFRDPDFESHLRFFDPIVAKWFTSTEPFSKSNLLESLAMLCENGSYFENFIAFFEGFTFGKWLYEIEMPHLRILGQMYLICFYIDVEAMGQLKSSLGLEAMSLEKEIYGMAGREFNILSPFEVSDVLFKMLKVTSQDTPSSTFSITSQRMG
jgi:hypothetical protein